MKWGELFTVTAGSNSWILMGYEGKWVTSFQNTDKNFSIMTSKTLLLIILSEFAIEK